MKPKRLSLSSKPEPDMKITKELLVAEIAKTQEERDQLIAQVNLKIGSIRTMEHLLGVLDLAEPPCEPKKR